MRFDPINCVDAALNNFILNEHFLQKLFSIVLRQPAYVSRFMSMIDSTDAEISRRSPLQAFGRAKLVFKNDLLKRQVFDQCNLAVLT